MKQHQPRARFARRRGARQGAAVVEFAVCLPVLLLIVFGSIEAASLLFLRQTLVQSAYEGAKVAIRNNGNASDATEAIMNVAAGRRIDQLAIDFNPSDFASQPQGTQVVVTVTAPGGSNSFIPLGILGNQQVSASAVMVKE
ncbi:MAG: Flp pilus assembly protein TadG [Mariniblastus sp.]|jgi:Flp pilus assembly protein TadG